MGAAVINPSFRIGDGGSRCHLSNTTLFKMREGGRGLLLFMIVMIMMRVIRNGGSI